MHVYSPGAGVDSPGDKILMSTERPYHFTHLLQVSKKPLLSLILYIFFHDLIHVYSLGAGTSCHFGHLLQVSKNSPWSLILYNFFHDFIHVSQIGFSWPDDVYSPGAGDKVLISTELSCHFIHLLQVSKKCLWSLILYNFFHDLIHVYSPGAGVDSPGDKILMSTERPYHFTHLLQVSKKPLLSLILYNFFHDLIHVYSLGAGCIQPPGDKVLMSTETSCHFIHILLVSNHRLQ